MSEQKKWAGHMQSILTANKPAGIGEAVVDTLAVYEAMRTGDETADATLLRGLAKGFESWRLEEARLYAVEKADALASTDERNADARRDPIAYRDHVRDETASFLIKDVRLSCGGQAVIVLIQIFSDHRTGDEFHDATFAAGLGLAFDEWSKHEAAIAQIMKGPRGQA